MRAPRLLAAGAATASLFALTGCQEPSPLVTVVSSGQSVHDEATSYCFDGQSPTKQPGTAGGCSFDRKAPKLLRVQQGEQVGIDVSKEVADRAWVVVIAPQAAGQAQQQGEQSSTVQTSHYFTFTPQFDGGTPLDLQVRSLASDAPNAQVTGVWRFVLAPK